MKIIKYSEFLKYVDSREYKKGVLNNIFQFDELFKPFPFVKENTDLNLDNCFLFAFRVSDSGLYDYCICEVDSDLYNLFIEDRIASPFLSELQNVRMKEKKADFTGYVAPSDIIRNLYQAGENLMNARDDLEYHFEPGKVDSEDLVNDLSYISDDFEDITLTQGIDIAEVADKYKDLAKRELQAKADYQQLIDTQNTEEGKRLVEQAIEQEVEKRLNQKSE